MSIENDPQSKSVIALRDSELQNSYEAGYFDGCVEERERIIALLEAERWTLPNGVPANGEVYLPIEQAIALIKGENE